MDPFEKLPEEIFDQILKYFSHHELLFILSLVSVRWFEVIGKSAVSMKNVKINLKSRRKTDFIERIDTLNWMSRKNSRKYLHVQINCLLNENVSEAFCNFLNSESCNQLVEINCRSMKVNHEVPVIELPQLKKLKLMFIPRQITNQFISSTKNLSKIILLNEVPLSYDELNEIYLPSENTIKCVGKCVENNEKLEELEIQGRANFYAFFHKDITPFVKCSLKKLTVKIEMAHQLLSETQETNFLSFLKSQKESLEHIYVDKFGPIVIEYIFRHMQKLTSIRLDLELLEPNKFDIKELNLMSNDKITNFELAYVTSYEDLKDYLELVPNVKYILIGHINPRVLKYVANYLPNLESLVYRYDDCAGGCEAQYENLKQEYPELINKNLKMSVCNDFM